MIDSASVRKTYVVGRIEEIIDTPGFRSPRNWRQTAKDQAHEEFNTLLKETYDRGFNDGFSAAYGDLK